jgi:hypothetical protein
VRDGKQAGDLKILSNTKMTPKKMKRRAAPSPSARRFTLF